MAAHAPEDMANMSHLGRAMLGGARMSDTVVTWYMLDTLDPKPYARDGFRQDGCDIARTMAGTSIRSLGITCRRNVETASVRLLRLEDRPSQDYRVYTVRKCYVIHLLETKE